MGIKVEVSEERRNGGAVDSNVSPSQCLTNPIPPTTYEGQRLSGFDSFCGVPLWRSAEMGNDFADDFDGEGRNRHGRRKEETVKILEISLIPAPQ